MTGVQQECGPLAHPHDSPFQQHILALLVPLAPFLLCAYESWQEVAVTDHPWTPVTI